MSAWTCRHLTVRPTQRLFPPFSNPILEGPLRRVRRSTSPQATSTLEWLDSLKALDPNRPIREADMCGATRDVRFGPIADIVGSDGHWRPKARIPFEKIPDLGRLAQAWRNQHRLCSGGAHRWAPACFERYSPA